jgi:flagellar protein FlaJ
MSSLSFLKQIHKSDNEKKTKKKIEKELPFFISIVTLLATSGFGPYTIFQKMHDIKLLPTIRQESIKILKRVDVLGLDPLAAMMEAKEKNASRSFGEFLAGYVSSIQAGGNVVNYLTSKLNSTFERYGDVEKSSVSTVKALVESFMTMQIVILAVYIIITATSVTGDDLASQSFDATYVVIIFPPIISLMFIILAHKMDSSKNPELDFKKIIMFGIPSVAIAFTLVLLNLIPDFNALIIGISLIVASLWPTIKYIKLGTFSHDAEEATPQILLDVAEARKTGIAPEQCIIKACKRKDFKSFNPVSSSIASKLEWGVPIKKIYESIESSVKNFQVLISFKILFEIISSGGGNVNTLDSLAAIAEKIRNIEKAKREMLKPYIIIGFIIVSITSFTTLMVIDSLTDISIQSEIDEDKKLKLKEEAKPRFEMLSMTILVQAWLAGLFLGKLTVGSYSGGFRISIVLVAITLIAIVMMQLGIFDINALFAK